MSALVLHKVSAAMGTGSCMEPGCSNKSRVTPQIIGYSLKGPIGSLELLCRKHAKQWVEAWRRFSGRDQHDQAAKAVEEPVSARGLAPNPQRVRRTEAIDALLTLGFETRLVLEARDAAAEGGTVEQVLEGLLAGATFEAVAA